MEHQEGARKEVVCCRDEDAKVGMRSYQDGQNRKQRTLGKNKNNRGA